MKTLTLCRSSSTGVLTILTVLKLDPSLATLFMSQEERNFPLAFSFVIYNRIAQVVRLFKAIYRPHNVYCFHPDKIADTEFVSTFK